MRGWSRSLIRARTGLNRDQGRNRTIDEYVMRRRRLGMKCCIEQNASRYCNERRLQRNLCLTRILFELVLIHSFVLQSEYQPSLAQRNDEF